MTAVFDYSKSRLADRLVLLVIADRSDDDGSGCWRGKESIARMAHVSRSTVTESISRLQASGELVVEERPGRTNLYRIVLPGVGQNPAALPATRPESGPLPGQDLAATRPDARPRSIPDPSVEPPGADAPSSPPKPTDRADTLVKGWWEAQTPRPMGNFMAIRSIVKKALVQGWSDNAVGEALWAIRDDPPVTQWKLERQLKAARRADPTGLNWDRGR